MASKKLKAVGIHIFAGLFSRGIQDAGYDLLATLEDGDFGVKTHRFNFPNTPVHQGGKDAWPLKELKAEGIDLVYSNSACANWSICNADKGKTPVAELGMEHANWAARRLAPQAFVLESVQAMFTAGDAMVKRWEHAWASLGYQTCRLKESGHHVGLPQYRKRALFIAAKANLDFQYDDPGFGVPEVTVREAISDLDGQNLSLKADANWALGSEYKSGALTPYQAQMRRRSDRLTWHIAHTLSPAITSMIPYWEPGKDARSFSEETLAKTYWPNRTNPINPKGHPCMLFRRLAWDRPSFVLTGGAHWFHPEQDRLLTIREQARLMGVPDDFQLTGTSLSNPYAELGKAVSPLVGAWIGRQLAGILARPEGRLHQSSLDLTKAGKVSSELPARATASSGTRKIPKISAA